jgi:endonuclease/exonuclease/phosphatase family metal-dependent hydrolase
MAYPIKSISINFGNGNIIIEKLFKKIRESGITVLFIQELPYGLEIPGFSRIAICNDARSLTDIYERVGIYVLTGSNYNITDVKCIKQEVSDSSKLKYGIVTRYANIVTINGIKIANIHLEGGRYSDAKILSHFDAIFEHKISLLVSVLNNNPHIIVGDFNSVYSNNIQKYNEYIHEQYYDFEFRKGTKLTNENFQLLQQLPEIIQESGEIGEFELDIFKVTINNLTTYEHTLIKV